MIIAVDFDGTIVDKNGKIYPSVIAVLKRLSQNHTLLLYSSRLKSRRKEALDFLRGQGVNISIPDPISNFGRKPLADIYVDDKNLLGLPKNGDDVDWLKIESILTKI